MVQKTEPLAVKVARLEERQIAQESRINASEQTANFAVEVAEEAKAVATQASNQVASMPMTIREAIREELKGRGVTLREWLIAIAAIAAILSPFVANAMQGVKL